MLFTLALILLLGLLSGRLCAKASLPPLMGMLLAGICIGPHGMNLMDSALLSISPQLRQIALIIILLRAGLNLKLEDLKRVGRPAVLLCFLPASLELLGMALLAPLLFGVSVMEALVLGTVIAAVSPAVIVPHMLNIMEEGFGVRQGIPQMILAGASADDVFVIVLFSCFTDMARTGSFAAGTLLRLPTSIVLGIAAGFLLGILLHRLMEAWALTATKTVLLLLSAAFLLVWAEGLFPGAVGFSGLIATMALGISCARRDVLRARQAADGLSRLWVAAEILLFVLVGAAVDLPYALRAGGRVIALIACVLLFRMAGVLLCLLGTRLNRRERLFTMLAYTPKATVQAAIGAVPLSMGLPAGELILTAAVAAILLTAPIGALLIDSTYRKLLTR